MSMLPNHDHQLVPILTADAPRMDLTSTSDWLVRVPAGFVKCGAAFLWIESPQLCH
jgi:hypothetical protein